MNDIEILERLIEDYEMCREVVCIRDIEAIKNLINRVKELEEENNILKEQIVYLTSTKNKDILKYWRKK